jgi:ligand-binding SRPBCC domain-containing protein
LVILFLFWGVTLSVEGMIFEASTRVRASAEELFRFHGNPQNIGLVMPPTTRIISVETDGPAVEGRIIVLKMRELFVLPMQWTAVWRKVRYPTLLVDAVQDGPFRLFVHEHRFEDQSDGTCVMHDRVTYAWGSGAIGAFISRTLLWGVLRLLFAYRHWRTSHLFAVRDPRVL